MSDLNRNQSKAITALLVHSTIEQAAEAANLTPRTIHRYLDDAEFRAALSQAEGAAIDLATRRLLRLGDKAIDALESVLDNPAQKGAGNKRLAAQAILDHLLKLRELRSVEQRISELERAVYGKAKN